MDFTKKYETKMSNAKKTLDMPVDLNSVYAQITDIFLKKSFEKLLLHEQLYFWDFGVRDTRQLKMGMIISIICGKDEYHFELVAMIEDLKGEIGDILGWIRQYRAPWKNVCALR